MATKPTTTVTIPNATETYASAYGRLAAIAERLRAGGPSMNVDTIVEDLKAARNAHAICKQRLDAIRRELDAEIADAESVPAS